MSTNKSRKASTPLSTEPQPRLRAVPQPAARPRPEPDPELRAMLDDMQRRYRVQRERLNLGDDEPEAA
jgi:hypothetical protein